MKAIGQVNICEQLEVAPDGALSLGRLVHASYAPAFPHRVPATLVAQVRADIGAHVELVIIGDKGESLIPVEFAPAPEKVEFRAYDLLGIEFTRGSEIIFELRVDGQCIASCGLHVLFLGRGAIPHPRSTLARTALEVPAWVTAREMVGRGRMSGERRRLYWLGYWDPTDGYGGISYGVTRELVARGWEVAAFRCPWDSRPFPEWVLDGVALPAGWANTGITCVLPTDIGYLPDGLGWLAAWTMWEADRIPQAWTPLLDACDEAWVPCEANVGLFHASGVTVPVRRVPIPVDVSAFAGEPRIRSGGLRFIFHGTPYARKGLDVLLRAWPLAFGRSGGDVSLRIVTKAAAKPETSDREKILAAVDDLVRRDPRVSVRYDSMPLESLVEEYRQADVFVFPSRGEGFGLTVAQAMAAGLLVIAPDHTGLGELVSDDTAIVVPCSGMSDAVGYYHGARWHEPDVDALASSMRAVAGMVPEYRAMKILAAKARVAAFSAPASVDSVEAALAPRDPVEAVV